MGRSDGYYFALVHAIVLYMKIQTLRLDLVAATIYHIVCELETPDKLSNVLNARVPLGWPPGEYDRGAQEFFKERLAEGGERAIGWYTWYAVRRATNEGDAVVVGACGYTGPPDEQGVVEIGYSVLPEFEGRGYATEMAVALTHHAFSYEQVRLVIARTDPTNVPSQKVVQKAGFEPGGVDSETSKLRFEKKRYA